MGLTAGRISTSNNITSNSVSSQIQPLYGVVYEVITDTGSDTAKSKGLDTAASIGSIRFRLLSDNSTNMNTNEQLPVAFPFDKNSITLPTKNEIIIIHSFGGNYHYSRVGGGITPNLNALTNLISNQLDNEIKLDSSSDAATYQNVSSTGISRTNKNSGKSDFDGYGEYFTDNSNIHKLKLYEGDTLLESRFGQSIRFSGYNNSENKFAPTITIRNGENPDSLQSNVGTSTEENINKDGNIIFLGSGEKLLEWTLPTTNAKESFFNYPSELKGNQILLSSDRIILSAKASQMIFASKEDMGFITDGQFSIDTTKGINVTADDNIYFDIKGNRDFQITTSGGGSISLGSTEEDELEAAAKGETLVELLGEMLDLIAQQIYVTPAGPSAPGPTSVAQFASLKAKLNSMLSSTVQLK
jgi:hypothetical protein